MKFAYRNSTAASFAFLAVLSIVGALLLTPACASGGHDFAGIYQVSNTTIVGDQVRLTFSARVFNYSDSDVTSATLTLKGPGAPHGVYATFYGLNLSSRGTVVISKEITIPTSEYQRWKMGQIPLLAIQSAAGISMVELHRGPVGGE